METLKKRWQVILAAVVVIAVGIVATLMLLPKKQNQAAPQPTPAPTTTTAAAEPSTPEEPSPSKTPRVIPTGPVNNDPKLKANCQAYGEGFVPVRYTISDPAVDADVMSLGVDAEGSIESPPKNLPKTAAWWNQGPQPGGDRGKAVLSIHTYRRGGAVGNQLFEGGKSQLKPGALIKLYGAKGEVACYEYTGSKKIKLSEYDDKSDMMVDFDGNPMVVIIVCWDHIKGTDDWASRVFFYGKAVTANG